MIFPKNQNYFFWRLETESNIAVETSWLLFLADELDVPVKIDSFLLLESAFNLRMKINNAKISEMFTS